MSTPPPFPPALPFPSPSPTRRPFTSPPPLPTIIGLAGSSCFLIGSPAVLPNQSARLPPPPPPLAVVDVGDPERVGAMLDEAVGVSSMSAGSAAALGEKRSEDETERVLPAAGLRVDVDEGDERSGIGGGGFGSTNRDVRRDESEGDDFFALRVRCVLGERKLAGLGFESEVEREMVLDPVRKPWLLYDEGMCDGVLETGGGRESMEERADEVADLGKKDRSEAGIRSRVRTRSVGGWTTVVGGGAADVVEEKEGDGDIDRSVIRGGFDGAE